MNAASTPTPEPAYFTIPMEPPRRRALPDRASGLWAELRLGGGVIEPLHTGSGVPELVDDRLVAGVAASPASGDGAGVGGRPLLPGSGVKGGLRAVFEAVTRSCDPLAEERCRSVTETCPACVLFGLGGRRGALAVSDLQVDGALGVRLVAQRHSHPHAPPRGRRLYGLEPETAVAEAAEALQVVERGARLTGTLALHGAAPWTAGVLVLVAGLVPDGLPLVRLGGGKNRGLGVATLAVEAGSHAVGEGAWLLGDRRPVTPEVLAGWAASAQAHPDLRRDQLDRIRQEYRGHAST